MLEALAEVVARVVSQMHMKIQNPTALKQKTLLLKEIQLES
jgi:hypothetical protein